MCGCGERTTIARHTWPAYGHKRGEPYRYKKHHHKRGEHSSRWKGRFHDSNGYMLVRAPDHPNAKGSGYIFEHRLVMERVLGRLLLPDERVHHKNGVRDDNSPENLELWSGSHPPGQRVDDLVAWAKNILALYGDAA